MATQQRQEVAVMLTDIVGFSSMSRSNEDLALELLSEHNQLLTDCISRSQGRVVKTIGDAFLATFANPLLAFDCAVAVQKALHARNEIDAPDRRLFVRIGLHRGVVVHRDNDIFGDVVNVTSRIEPLAEPGGICVSGDVYEQVRLEASQPLVYLGKRTLKHIDEPLALYKVVLPWFTDQSLAIGERESARTPSVAVLPFEDRSPKRDQQYLSDGISGELIDQLSRIDGLRVVSSSTSFAFRDAEIEPAEIGRIAGVSHVLTGSTQLAGEQLRTTARLVSVEARSQVWSEKFDRELANVFEMQDEISQALARGLEVKLLGAEKTNKRLRHGTDETAYIHYLKGRYFWNRRDKQSLLRSLEHYEAAIAIDASYAAAHAGIADTFLVLAGHNHMLSREVAPQIKNAASRALDLDPSLAGAHVALGWMKAVNDWDWEIGLAHFEEALANNPNYATGRQWGSWLLFLKGDFERAVNEMQHAHLLDPLSPIIDAEAGLLLACAGEPNAGIERLEGTLGMAPDFQLAHLFLGYAYGLAGDLEQAIGCCEQATKLPGDIGSALGYLGHYQALLGRDDEARRTLDKMKALETTTYVASYPYAALYLGMGEIELSLDYLEKSASARDQQFAPAVHGYLKRFFQGNQRFDRLWSETGLQKWAGSA